MNNEDIKHQIVEALTNGTLQPTNIIIGDQIQHQHNIGKVEAGGIGVNIVQSGAPSLPRPHEGRYNGEREYYQVAYTVNDEKTLNRELSSLRKIKDTYPKFLLTTDFDSANIDGIRKINVIDWLSLSSLPCSTKH